MADGNVSKNENFAKIIQDVFEITSFEKDLIKQQKIKDFISYAVNGDTPLEHLAINANLSEKSKGTTVLILTDKRLIKIDIHSTGEIQSSSFPLNTLLGIDRKLTNDGRFEIGFTFQNGSFGLRYPEEDRNITEFLQKIDQAGMV